MSPKKKDQKIKRLERDNLGLHNRIAELEIFLGWDSKTCSKPPLTDGLKTSSKIWTKSLTEKRKRAPGGYKGHWG